MAASDITTDPPGDNSGGAGASDLVWPFKTTLNALNAIAKLIEAGALGAGAGGGSLLNYQIITASGTFTPDALTTAMDVLVIGGSAGSPYVPDVVPSWHGGLPSATECRKRYTSIAPSYAVTIGAGGNGGTVGAPNGTAGGDTTFGALTAPGAAAPTDMVLAVAGAGAAKDYIFGIPADYNLVPTGGDANQNFCGHNGGPFFYDPAGTVGGGQGGDTSMGRGALFQGLNVQAVAGQGFGSGTCGALVTSGALNGVAGRPGCVVVLEYS